ncbi:uncharacterized protein LOC131617507 [Vicia villosa]|uniref:uncharacterized protein LOC131617507 n=1 Tax=Vicia villosa TaxID=3911 RepID=UPI00273AACF2|nr:uncharacterized protein LOC131617507 [Vicia villosa]
MEAETQRKVEETAAMEVDTQRKVSETAAMEVDTQRKVSETAAMEVDTQRKVSETAAMEVDTQRKVSETAAMEVDTQRKVSETVVSADTHRKVSETVVSADTHRKVSETVMDILTKCNTEVATEFTVLDAASKRLDLSDSRCRQFVKNTVHSYLNPIATHKKPVPEELEIHNDDDSEAVICQLSTNSKVTVGNLKGMPLVSIREYDLKEGKLLPTVEGISFTPEQWSTFKNNIPAIEEAIKELERRPGSGHSGWKYAEVSSSAADVPVEPASIKHVPIELVPIEIVRFDGKNYQVWAEQIELLLKQLKINHVLTDACARKISKAKATEKRWVNDDDSTCRRNILCHLSDSLFNKYANGKMSAKELWEELKRVYLTEEYGTKTSLMKKYIEFQMVDEKAVADQIQELNDIADSIVAAGMQMDENFRVSVIISKLPLSWKNVCIKLMCEEQLPFRMLMKHITIEEESRNGVKQVVQPDSQGGNIWADIKQSQGFRKYLPNVCHICGEKGHTYRKCAKLPRFDGKKKYHLWAEQMELLLKQMNIIYVLTEPCPTATLVKNDASAGENSKAKAAEKKWVNDDLMCRCYILGHLSDSLFNKYANRKMRAKELWEELKYVYFTEEYGTKRSLVKKYIEFQMVDEKAVAGQIQELNDIADSIVAAGMQIDENFQVSVIVSKLPLSWKDLCIKLKSQEYIPLKMLMDCIKMEEKSRNGVKQDGELHLKM